MNDPRVMIDKMKRQSMRTRTAILALPQYVYGLEKQIAALLNIDTLDYPEYLLKHTPVTTNYLELSESRIYDDLNDIANAISGEICMLITNFDIAILKLPSKMRINLWRLLFQDYPYRKRSLVLCIPQHDEGRYTIPDAKIRTMWIESDRYAVWQNKRTGERS